MGRRRRWSGGLGRWLRTAREKTRAGSPGGDHCDPDPPLPARFLAYRLRPWHFSREVLRTHCSSPDGPPHGCDPDLKGTRLCVPTNPVRHGFAIFTGGGDFGLEAVLERATWPFLGHAKADGRPTYGTPSFVGHLHHEASAGASSGSMNSAVAFNNLNLEESRVLSVTGSGQDYEESMERKGSAGYSDCPVASRTAVILSGPPARFAASTSA